MVHRVYIKGCVNRLAVKWTTSAETYNQLSADLTTFANTIQKDALNHNYHIAARSLVWAFLTGLTLGLALGGFVIDWKALR